MDIDKARQFIRENHSAVLATYRADGRPQMSPVGAAVDDDGMVGVSSRETAYKVKNLRRDPRVSLLVTMANSWEWIQVDGTASVLSLPEAMEPLVDHYRRVAGEHPDWDDYRAAMERERRLLIRIEIERAGPDRMG
ncbi:MAG TPA: PPOX class F420-dependent oxidoreductase [Acidimicrobiales bacterium]|nr:PPOX class F420-dependent oxidoreductase [Acidimicrobiales bacterium]